MPDAERAAWVAKAIDDPGAPDVIPSARAAPPYFPIGARRQVAWVEVTVALPVELSGDLGRDRCQGIRYRRPFAQAEGAACTLDGPVHRRGAPPMVRPCGTPPPDVPIRRARDLCGRERSVALEIEFADESRVPGERAHGTASQMNTTRNPERQCGSPPDCDRLYISLTPDRRSSRNAAKDQDEASVVVSVEPPPKERRTRTYVSRRTHEGLSKPAIIRCLKRYIAREVFRLLQKRLVLASTTLASKAA